MSTVETRLTADEYLSRDFSRFAQLIDGVVVVNSPSWPHQSVCGDIYVALRAWGEGQVTLQLDVRVDDHNVLAPDLLWFAEPLPMDAPRAIRVPDLVVEVLSPSTRRYDVGRKRELYIHHGVKELWLVDPERRSVLVVTPAGEEEREVLTSELLPGFRHPLR
jgi:Uma2 family endonuclease